MSMFVLNNFLNSVTLWSCCHFFTPDNKYLCC